MKIKKLEKHNGKYDLDDVPEKSTRFLNLKEIDPRKCCPYEDSISYAKGETV